MPFVVMESLESRQLLSASIVAHAKMPKTPKPPKSGAVVSPVGTWHGSGSGKFLEAVAGIGTIPKKPVKLDESISILATGNSQEPIRGIVSDRITGLFEYFNMPGTLTAVNGGKWSISLNGNNYTYGGYLETGPAGDGMQFSATMNAKGTAMTGTYVFSVNGLPYFSAKFSLKK